MAFIIVLPTKSLSIVWSCDYVYFITLSRFHVKIITAKGTNTFMQEEPYYLHSGQSLLEWQDTVRLVNLSWKEDEKKFWKSQTGKKL
jgi:hypothetical protein